jgi:hypothetical protein
MARNRHPRSRRVALASSILLPLRVPARAQDFCALLGLLAPLGRGAPYGHVQIQHLPTACAHWRHHGSAGRS